MNLSELKISKYFKKDMGLSFVNYGFERFWSNPDLLIEISANSDQRHFLSHIDVNEDLEITLNTTEGKYFLFEKNDDFILHIYTLKAMV